MKQARPNFGRGRGYVALVMAALMSATMIGAAAPERPRDPWVFRCVLDKNPRMVVIALHEDLWAAYDAKTCSLYKLWRGGVKFDGAVYTTVHGPQPTSIGEAYFAGPEGDVWKVMLLDEPGLPPRDVMTIQPRWKGYVIRDEQVTLHYELHLPDGRMVSISETPEWEEDDRGLVLQRSFAAEVPKDVSVHLLASRFVGDVEASNVEMVSLSIVNGVLPHDDGSLIEVTAVLEDGGGAFQHRLAQPNPAGDTNREVTR